MAKNEFLPFGIAEGANVLSNQEYERLAARFNGFVSGVAKSKELNTVWRQSSIMSSALAQFIVDSDNKDLLDNGDVASVKNRLVAAIKQTISGVGYVTTAAMNLELNKKFDKANISGVKGNDNDKAPSLNLFTTEIGKLQPKGNYQPAGDYATNAALTSGLSGKQPTGNYANGVLFYKTTNYTGMRNEALNYAAMIYDDGRFTVWSEDARKFAWGFNGNGEMIAGLIPLEFGGTGAKTAAAARTNLSVHSKEEVNTALAGKQQIGNYANGDIFYNTASLVGMRTTSKNYALVNFENGDMGGWDEANKGFTFRFNNQGKLINGTVPASLVTGLAQVGVNQKTTNMLSQRSTNTTYTNDTGVPILVSIAGTYTPGTNSSLVLVVDGQTIGGIAGGSGSTIPIFVSHIVPAGKDYRVNMAGTQTKLDNWTELR